MSSSTPRRTRVPSSEERAVMAAVGLSGTSATAWDSTTSSSSSSSSSDDNGDDDYNHNVTTLARHGEKSEEDDRSMKMLWDPAQQVTALNYVAEHRIFLKAVLELLSQRDDYSGIKVDMNDPHTIKCGPLKKASHRIRGAWKVYYVELRRGLLSYYEDTACKDSLNEERLSRKNVALQANEASVRPVKVQGLTGGAVFELDIEGRPKKLWMASTKKERQAWMAAIQASMVGGSVVRGDAQAHHAGGRRAGAVSPTSPYHADLRTYLQVQNVLLRATTKEGYVGALKGVFGSSLHVPVQWIRERTESKTTTTLDFLEQDTSVGVRQIWKDLQRDSVNINGEVFYGDGGHGPERIVGALTRSIMMLDKTFANESGSFKRSKTFGVTESQALSYARDVLLAGNRTRSGGDSYFCVDTLCKNANLVVLCPSTTQAEPLTIQVEPVVAEKDTVQDESAWLKSRSRPQKPWKKRYLILSEGTLSFYEKAQPRPHGLCGQLVLAHASLQITQEEAVSRDGKQRLTRTVVSIIMKDGTKGRQLCFEDDDKFMLWTSALEDAIAHHAGRSSLTKSVVSKVRRGLRDEMDGVDSSEGRGGIASLKEYAAARYHLDETALENRITLLRQRSGKAKASVNISVRASTEYKISTNDPQGDEEQDTWAWIRASFLQDFCVTGGPNGRIKRGEEIVQICIQDHALES